MARTTNWWDTWQQPVDPYVPPPEPAPDPNKWINDFTNWSQNLYNQFAPKPTQNIAQTYWNWQETNPPASDVSQSPDTSGWDAAMADYQRQIDEWQKQSAQAETDWQNENTRRQDEWQKQQDAIDAANRKAEQDAQDQYAQQQQAQQEAYQNGLGQAQAAVGQPDARGQIGTPYEIPNYSAYNPASIVGSPLAPFMNYVPPNEPPPPNEDARASIGVPPTSSVDWWTQLQQGFGDWQRRMRTAHSLAETPPSDPYVNAVFETMGVRPEVRPKLAQTPVVQGALGDFFNQLAGNNVGATTAATPLGTFITAPKDKNLSDLFHEFAHNWYGGLPSTEQQSFNAEFQKLLDAPEHQYSRLLEQANQSAAQSATARRVNLNDITPDERYAYLIAGVNGAVNELPPSLQPFYTTWLTGKPTVDNKGQYRVTLPYTPPVPIATPPVAVPLTIPPVAPPVTDARASIGVPPPRSGWDNLGRFLTYGTNQFVNDLPQETRDRAGNLLTYGASQFVNDLQQQPANYNVAQRGRGYTPPNEPRADPRYAQTQGAPYDYNAETVRRRYSQAVQQADAETRKTTGQGLSAAQQLAIWEATQLHPPQYGAGQGGPLVLQTRPPMTNMLGWDTTRAPDTAIPKSPQQYSGVTGQPTRGSTIDMLNQGLVKLGTDNQLWFVDGAFSRNPDEPTKKLPAQYWQGAEQAVARWVQEYQATNGAKGMSPAWATEYLNLIKQNSAYLEAAWKPSLIEDATRRGSSIPTWMKALAARRPVVAPTVMRPTAPTNPYNYPTSGYGGYPSSGGYPSYYGGGGGAPPTPATSTEAGWNRAWQRLRI